MSEQAHARPAPAPPELELRAWLLAGDQLGIHVDLVNPTAAVEPRLVPRLMTPLGLLVGVTVLDEDGGMLWASTRPKAKLKLHPQRRESYIELAPGYSYGVEFRLPRVPADRAESVTEIRLTYTNGPFTGPRKHPIGTLDLETTIRRGELGHFAPRLHSSV
jgi:hypothetical protein